MPTFSFLALRRASSALLASTALLAASCGDDGETTPIEPITVPTGCNPLVADVDCLLPYPSDFFLTGGKVEIPEPARLVIAASPADLLKHHPVDGFPVGTPILAVLAEPMAPTGLVPYTADTTPTAASPTLIIEADSGRLVRHFAELDPRATDPARRGLVIHPLERLAHGKRYVVAISRMQSPAGVEIAPSAAFANVRDRAGDGNPILAELATRYARDVFPVTDAFVDRKTLQLAWDFTVVSEANTTDDLLEVRRQTMAALSASPPVVKIVSVTDSYNDDAAQRIEATMTVPLFLETPDVGARLHYENGKVAQNGTVEVPFSVWIPYVVRDRAPTDPPARLMQFGHGFFGTRDEADDFASQFANQYGFVVVAADWWGMSRTDALAVIGSLTGKVEDTFLFTDRLHQGFANFIALTYAATGPLAALPELQIQGAPAYDPSFVGFYGISQGHILGSTFVALSPQIDRAVLDVGGIDLSLIMFRAQPFAPFLGILANNAPDPLDHQKFAAIAQSTFDRVDPVTYAPHLLSNTFEGSPPSRKIAMRMGIGDHAVPNIATYYQAAVLGVPLLAEASAESPSYLTSVASPALGSALTVHDLGVVRNDVAIPATEANIVHEGVRRLHAAMEQANDFLRPDGVVVNKCSGVCDPE